MQKFSVKHNRSGDWSSTLKTIEIYMARHGKTTKQQPGQSDFDRVLTFEGVNESMAVGKSMDVKFDLVISSNAIRAAHTAACMAGIHMDDVCWLAEVYPDPVQYPAFNAGFERIGYALLGTYYLLGQQVIVDIEAYAELALKLIMQKTIEKADADQDVLNVLVVSHAVCANAIALAAARKTKDLDPKHIVKIAETNMATSSALKLVLNIENDREKLMDVEYITPPAA